MSTAYLAEHGETLVRNGYRILPIEPGTKRPNLPGWPEVKADVQTIRRWRKEGRGAWGVGVLGEETPGIDLDITDETILHKMLAWCDGHIGLAPRRIGRPPRVLLVCRADIPFGKFKSRKFTAPDGATHQVEILGKGAQFVAHAIHPDTRAPYVWPEVDILGTPVDFLPGLTEAQARQLVAYFESIVPDDWTATQADSGAADGTERLGNPLKTANLELVESAVAAIPNDDIDYDDWIRVGHAIKGALPGQHAEACAVFHTFSAKSDKYDPETTQTLWDAIKEVKALGAGTIFYLAGQHGWQRPRPTATEEFGELPANTRGVQKLIEDAAERGAKAQHRTIPTVSFAESISRALNGGAPPLIEGLLFCGSLTVMYGKPNSGKSFVALDMAACIAAGRPWDGRPTEKGAVLYIAAEGGGGFHKRTGALARERNLSPDTPLRIATCPVDLFDVRADLTPLVNEAKRIVDAGKQPLRLIVIDTLNRAMAGGDENTSTDMGQFIANVDLLRERTGAAVLIVHHSGKDAAKGARGHSSLVAAVDTEVEIAVSPKAVGGVVHNTKQRDGERIPDVRFELRKVALGTDERGREVTSCVVRYLSGSEFEPIQLSPVQERFKRALEKAMVEAGGGAATAGAWERAYVLDLNPAWCEGLDRPDGCSPKRLRTLRREVLESGHARKVGADSYAPPFPS